MLLTTPFHPRTSARAPDRGLIVGLALLGCALPLRAQSGDSAGTGLIAAGYNHTCAVTTSGVTYCWGNNTLSQLGNRQMDDRPRPSRVATDTVLVSVAVGGVHSCGLDARGTAYCWGGNLDGELGTGPGALHGAPTPVAGGLVFRSLSAGTTHTCGLAADGAAWCWGKNTRGQLGDGTSTSRPTPVRVAGELRFRSVSAGFAHTCAVAVDGAGYCWGANDEGQLGDSSLVSRPTPTLVSGCRSWLSLSAGANLSCGVTTEGTAYCWGWDLFGQLGSGRNPDEEVAKMTSPIPVVGGHVFRAVSAGGVQTCGVTPGGDVLCWGVRVPSPVPVLGGPYLAVSSGTTHVCAVAATGRAYCWGSNDFGQLGDSSTTERRTPVAVARGLVVGTPQAQLVAARADSTRAAAAPSPPGGAGSPLRLASIGAGVGYTCGLATDGAAYCWGAGSSGQLGSQVWRSAAPVRVAGGLMFAAISVGWGHACGLTAAGAAWCWGHNDVGQLGSGVVTEFCDFGGQRAYGGCSPVPVPVAGGLTFKAISAGQLHTCALTTAGAAYCWGANGDPAVWDSAATTRCTWLLQRLPCVPRPVAVPGGLTFASISAGGGGFTCAVAVDGAAYCWLAGPAGPYAQEMRWRLPGSAPTPVAGGLGFASVSAGESPQVTLLPPVYACGIGTDARLLCWNFYQFDRPPTPSGGELRFRLVSAGNSHLCALTTEGAAYCLGAGGFGQLGTGEQRVGTEAPIPVAGSVRFASLAVGGQHTCALTGEGEGYCWGGNSAGELGAAGPVGTCAFDVERYACSPSPVRVAAPRPAPPARPVRRR